MDVQELHSRAAGLKSRIRTLTTERQQLAPYAVNGDARGPQARARIAAIDAERQQATSDLETVEDALRSPDGHRASLATRLDAAYERKKPRMQRQLIFDLTEQYENLAAKDNLTNRGTYKSPFVLADLPRMIAAGHTLEDITAHDLRWISQRGDANPHQLEELTVKLDCYRRHTNDLLATTELPPIPAELEAKLNQLGISPSDTIGAQTRDVSKPDRRDY